MIFKNDTSLSSLQYVTCVHFQFPFIQIPWTHCTSSIYLLFGYDLLSKDVHYFFTLIFNDDKFSQYILHFDK